MKSLDRKGFSIEIHLLSIHLNLFSIEFATGSPHRGCISQVVKAQNPSLRSPQASFNSFSEPWWICLTWEEQPDLMLEGWGYRDSAAKVELLTEF